ncbi:HIRAN domain-containing protein [Aquifex sp.]
MKISIKLGRREIPLVITPEGDFILSEGKVKGREITFSSEEVGSFSLIIPESGEEVDFGFSKFVELGKGLSLLEGRVLFLAYKVLKPYRGASLDFLIKKVFGEKLFTNFLVEGILGDFSYEEEDPEQLAEEFLSKTDIFYTHVVGFGYRVKEFLKGEELLVKEGDRIYAVWEKENPHDENAVAVYHESGKKLGYIRKTISPFLVKRLKTGYLFTGKVIKVMPRHYNDNERIYVELSF